MISDSPDPDKIVMIVDPSGGRGKSTFVKYCVYKKLGSFLSFSTYDNLKYNAAKALNQRAFLVDFPRQKPFELHWSSIFTALEQIKSGLWTSDKYQNIVVMIPRPHLVCFSNYMPELALLSLYKWSIASISDETTDFEFYTEEALVEIMEEQKAAKEEYKKKKRGQDN
jgi:hypothetical protein